MNFKTKISQWMTWPAGEEVWPQFQRLDPPVCNTKPEAVRTRT